MLHPDDEAENGDTLPLPPEEAFLDRLARVAPWTIGLEPVSVIARVMLAGAILLAAKWAWGLGSWLTASVAYFGNVGYVFLAVIAWQIRQKYKRFNPGTVHGSAKWADKKALAADKMLGHRDGILLGRFKEQETNRLEAVKRLLTRPLSDSDSVVRHFLTSMTGGLFRFYNGDDEPLICAPPNRYVSMLTVAPTGAGKGIGVVIPNLLNYKHSVVILDVKGENYEFTAERRKAMGQKVIVLDPFHISGTDSATLNPLDLIDADSPTLLEDLRALAETLVIKSPDAKEPHWDEHAVNLIYAMLIPTVLENPPHARNLNEVRAILSNPKLLKECIEYMEKSEAMGGIVARAFGIFSGMEDKEFSSVRSTANRHTAFLDSPLIAENVATTSGFDLRTIAKEKTSLYLILPAQYLQSHSRLMRMWLNSILLAMKQSPIGEKNEVLLMLDEVAQLGEMQPLREALTLLRGWGVRLWFITQSINQLEEAYPGPKFKTMLANFGIKQFFGIADPETAKYAAEMIGKRTAITPSMQEGGNTGTATAGSSRGKSWSNTLATAESPLIRPEEVMRESGADSVFIFQQGRFPILARRLTYYADREFTGRGDSRSRYPASMPSRVVCVLGICLLLYYSEQWVDLRSLANPRTWRSAPLEAEPDIRISEHPDIQEAESPPPIFLDVPPARKRTPPPPPDFAVTCPQCGNKDIVPAALAGQRIHCTTCDAELQMPGGK